MATTLYIVDEAPFSTLPKVTRDQAIAEVKGIFGFVSGFAVSPTSPSSFPTRFDFTDSVIRVVETDANVDANQSNRTQTANINFSIKQTGANLQPMPMAAHAPALPDRGGVGFQNKQVVTSGTQVIAIVVTGGFASLETAKTAVVEFLADGKSKKEVEDDREKAIKGTAKHKPEGLGYFGKHKALVDTRRMMMWEMLAKPLPDWPDEHKKSVRGALGRIIAMRRGISMLPRTSTVAVSALIRRQYSAIRTSRNSTAAIRPRSQPRCEISRAYRRRSQSIWRRTRGTSRFPSEGV